MKRLLATLGVLAVSTMTVFAADPAKMVDTKMGKVMADQNGMTLYTFDKDEPGKSNCDAKCLANWPAFAAAIGAMAEGEWTIVKDSAGMDMWAYDGKPLYTFVKDTMEGDVNGDGVGGVWHVAK